MVALPIALGLTAAASVVVGPLYGGYRLVKICHRAHENAKDSSYYLDRRRRQPETASLPRLIRMSPLDNEQ